MFGLMRHIAEAIVNAQVQEKKLRQDAADEIKQLRDRVGKQCVKINAQHDTIAANEEMMKCYSQALDDVNRKLLVEQRKVAEQLSVINSMGTWAGAVALWPGPRDLQTVCGRWSGKGANQSNIPKCCDKLAYSERCSPCLVAAFGGVCKPKKKRVYWMDEQLSGAWIYVYCSHRDPSDKQGHFARFHNNDEGKMRAEQYVKFLNSLE